MCIRFYEASLKGYRTIDIMPQAGESTDGITQVGTAKMGDLIAERV